MTAFSVVLSAAKDLVLRPSEPTRSFERWNRPQDDTPSVVLNEVKDLGSGFLGLQGQAQILRRFAPQNDNNFLRSSE